MTKAIATLQNISFSNPNKKILENTRKKEHLDNSLFCFCKKEYWLSETRAVSSLRARSVYLRFLMFWSSARSSQRLNLAPLILTKPVIISSSSQIAFRRLTTLWFSRNILSTEFARMLFPREISSFRSWTTVKVDKPGADFIPVWAGFVSEGASAKMLLIHGSTSHPLSKSTRPLSFDVEYVTFAGTCAITSEGIHPGGRHNETTVERTVHLQWKIPHVSKNNRNGYFRLIRCGLCRMIYSAAILFGDVSSWTKEQLSACPERKGTPYSNQKLPVCHWTTDIASASLLGMMDPRGAYFVLLTLNLSLYFRYPALQLFPCHPMR